LRIEYNTITKVSRKQYVFIPYFLFSPVGLMPRRLRRNING